MIGYKAGGSTENAASNYNTYIGYESGKSAGATATADSNTAIGAYTLTALSTGDKNVAIGAYAGDAMTTASDTVLVGYGAGSAITTEAGITAIGHKTLFASTGNYNTAVGYTAGQAQTSAGDNTFIGSYAGQATTTGGENTAVGRNAMLYNVDGIRNTVLGAHAGYGASTKSFGDCTLIGTHAGTRIADNVEYVIALGGGACSDMFGSSSIGIGQSAMAGSANTTLAQDSDSKYNIGMGSETMRNIGGKSQKNIIIGFGESARYVSGATISEGSENIGMGYAVLRNILTGSYNVAIGNTAGYSLTNAVENTILGYNAGSGTTGNYNTIIGSKAAPAATSMTTSVVIGRQAVGVGVMTGSDNTIIGYEAGNNYVGSLMTAVGASAGGGITTHMGDGGFYGGRRAGYLAKGDSNIALGQDAMYYQSGNKNIAIGNQAMYGNTSTTEGDHNIGLGYYALYSTTTGEKNIAIGASSLDALTTGSDNVVMGYAAATASTGSYNVIIGSEAAKASTAMGSGVVIGRQAGLALSTSSQTGVIIGALAGSSITDGAETALLGFYAGKNGNFNYSTILGHQAGEDNTADYVTMVGWQAGAENTAGTRITAFGAGALKTNTTGNQNCAVGYVALGLNVHGDNNTAVGNAALYKTAPADGEGDNTALGYYAGYENTTGTGNVFIGKFAGYNQTTDDNKLFIANSETATPLIGGDFSAKTLTFTADNVAINSSDANEPVLTLKNSHTGDSPSFLTFQKGGDDATDGDEIGQIQFKGQDDAGTPADVMYADMYVTSEDVSAGAEDASINYRVMNAGTLTSLMTINNSGVVVTGTLSATAKSFNLEHPLYKDKRLVHGSLEGPEHGIYIRGTIEAKEYGCEIELPEYWGAMCEDYTVQLTPHGPYTVYIKEKQKDKVMIACSTRDYKFDYYIVGARTDETLEVVQDG